MHFRKLQRTGSIKFNNSAEDSRSGFRVESLKESRSKSRSGSRARWGNGMWTDNEVKMKKEKRGDSCH